MAKIKVSQSTIDDIKRMGMTSALRLAGQNAKASQGGVTAEFQEGVRRMYGERRLSKAAAGGYEPKTTTKSGSKGTPPTGKPKSNSTPSKPNYTSKSTAQAAPKTTAYAQGKKGMVNSKSDYKTSSKASTGMNYDKPLPKNASIADKAKWIVGGALRQTGKDVLMFGTGGAGTAATLGTRAALKVGTAAAKKSALSASGRIVAKAGKPVSQSQYDAMLAAASKASKIKAAAAAAKAAAAKAGKATSAIKSTADSARAAATSTAGRVVAKSGKAVSQSQYDAMLAAAAKASKAKAAKAAAAKVVGKAKTTTSKVSSSADAARQTATSTAGRVTAKFGKPVSQSQYDAMIAAAKKKGIPTVKTPKPKVKK